MSSCASHPIGYAAPRGELQRRGPVTNIGSSHNSSSGDFAQRPCGARRLKRHGQPRFAHHGDHLRSDEQPSIERAGMGDCPPTGASSLSTPYRLLPCGVCSNFAVTKWRASRLAARRRSTEAAPQADRSEQETRIAMRTQIPRAKCARWRPRPH
jgi:hypothetical protein